MAITFVVVIGTLMSDAIMTMTDVTQFITQHVQNASRWLFTHTQSSHKAHHSINTSPEAILLHVS